VKKEQLTKKNKLKVTTQKDEESYFFSFRLSSSLFFFRSWFRRALEHASQRVLPSLSVWFLSDRSLSAI
jgi:hypothetical protein